MIQEEILKISSTIEEIVGTFEDNIRMTMLNKWIGLYSVPDYANQSRFIKNDKIRNKIYEKGRFVLERFIKVSKFNGKDANYVGTAKEFWTEGKNEFVDSESGKCGNFGLRLSYVAPISPITTPILNFLKKNDAAIHRDKAYILENGKVCVIPLASVLLDKTYDSVKDFGTFDIRASTTEAKLKLLEDEKFKKLFNDIFPLNYFLSTTAIYQGIVADAFVPGLSSAFEQTKESIKLLLRTLGDPDSDQTEWWKKPDSINNLDSLRKQTENFTTTSAVDIGLAAIVARTIPTLIKGLAENFDPYYQFVKSTGLDLDLSAIPKAFPINILPPFLGGRAPPITSLGFGALAVNLLPGEQKEKDRKDTEEEECEDVDI